MWKDGIRPTARKVSPIGSMPGAGSPQLSNQHNSFLRLGLIVSFYKLCRCLLMNMRMLARSITCSAQVTPARRSADSVWEDWLCVTPGYWSTIMWKNKVTEEMVYCKDKPPEPASEKKKKRSSSSDSVAWQHCQFTVILVRPNL